MAVPGDRDSWAVDALLRYFTRRNGRWHTPTGEAWQPALALEAVLNTYERTREVSYRHVVEKSFARYRGRRSRFYDDDGWYLNTWLRAYDVIGDPAYLDEARVLFAGLTTAWDGTCGGGVWWNHERTYKNAITNELFSLAAARLYRRTQETWVLDWAQRAFTWFRASGLINEANLVNDGLDGNCRNNGGPTWTYNQGVILSALVEWWRVTADDATLEQARAIARASIATLVYPDGVLREPSEPDASNADAHVFKGVFTQGLARLYEVDAHDEFLAFLTTNADAIWHSGRHPDRGVGLVWGAPGSPITAATQISATLLFGHLALLEGDVRRG